MKSTIEGHEIPKCELPFPKLMISELGGNVYFMKDANNGQRVWGKQGCGVGDILSSEVLKHQNLSDFTGVVILENDK